VNTDPMVVRDLFAGHYFLFAFLASLGTLQIAVSNAGTRGLWLTPHAAMTRLLGIALILTAIAVFFLQPLWVDGPWAAGSVEADSLSRDWGKASWDELAGARNVNDIHGGLDGVKQTGWFSLAATLALAVSAIVGTVSVKILNVADKSSDVDVTDPNVGGLEGLKNRSYFANLPSSLRNFRNDIGGLWRDELGKADRWSVVRMLSRRGDSSK
jgi:hypothetical protein